MEADVADFDWASVPSLINAGIDLTGLCMLTGVLAVSAWYCLSPPPTLRHAAPSAAQQHGILLVLCALAAPLLLLASLAGALALTQQAGMALPSSHPARLLVWGLYAAIGLAQLFALQRLAYWPAPRLRRLLPLTASALLLLPLATGLALLALEHRFLVPGSMPRTAIVAAALAAVSGILLWLPLQLRSCVSVDTGPARTEPVMASAEPAATPQPAVDSAAPEGKAARSAAQEMERQLQEISAMLEQEQNAAEQNQRAQDEMLYASAMRQQVNSQKFLFESGLPCNLAMLINGLIILDLPLDIHDHVRGDTLLHAAVREADVALVRQLLDHGVSASAPNWAGLSARAGAEDAEILALLEAAETPAR